MAEAQTALRDRRPRADRSLEDRQPVGRDGTRLDHLSRNEGVQEILRATEWDLIVVDEAHKMSASFWCGEIDRTKRYGLGEVLAGLTRHFLLMSATPHNGKEEDFQLFMGLLDQDRFEGMFPLRAQCTDVSDLMRRMVKEELKKFDGTKQ